MASSQPERVSAVAIPQHDSVPHPDVHLLPFTIDYSGEAKVDTFFHPQQVQIYKSALNNVTISGTLEPVEAPPGGNKDQLYTAYFRGRQLTGRRIPLDPASSVGVLIEPISPPANPGGSSNSLSTDIPPYSMSQMSQYHQVPDVHSQDSGDESMCHPGQSEAENDQQHPSTGKVVGYFDHVTVWKRDNEPSVQDFRTRVIEEFPALATAFHDNC